MVIITQHSCSVKTTFYIGWGTDNHIVHRELVMVLFYTIKTTTSGFVSIIKSTVSSESVVSSTVLAEKVTFTRLDTTSYSFMETSSMTTLVLHADTMPVFTVERVLQTDFEAFQTNFQTLVAIKVQG